MSLLAAVSLALTLALLAPCADTDDVADGGSPDSGEPASDAGGHGGHHDMEPGDGGSGDLDAGGDLDAAGEDPVDMGVVTDAAPTDVGVVCDPATSGPPDLWVESTYRATAYWHAVICNRGGCASEHPGGFTDRQREYENHEWFKLRWSPYGGTAGATDPDDYYGQEDVAAFDDPDFYPAYLVPQPGECVHSIGVDCSFYVRGMCYPQAGDPEPVTATLTIVYEEDANLDDNSTIVDLAAF